MSKKLISIKHTEPSKEYQDFVEGLVKGLESYVDNPHTAKLILLDAISLISFRMGHMAAHDMENKQ